MYASGMLNSRGTPCSILRTPPVPSKALLERVRRSGDPSTRDGDWTGIMLADSVLISGDLFTIGADTYLTQSVTPTAGALQWFALKCNAVVALWRYTETVDQFGTITKTWAKVQDTVTFAQIVTANLRRADPGLLDAARYLFEVPKSLAIVVLDRFVFDGRNFQVESIDDVAMAGVVRLQLGQDVRA